MALTALVFPLLLCAETKRIEMDRWHCEHKTPTESSVPVEVFFEDCDKELTIKFLKDCAPVTIEVRNSYGTIIYHTDYVPQEKENLSILLYGTKNGECRLLISNQSVYITGLFTIK